jgi:hypothetical protein
MLLLRVSFPPHVPMLTCDRDLSLGGTVTTLGNPAQAHDSRQLAQGRHNSSVGLSLHARCDATNIGDEAQTQPHPLQSSLLQTVLVARKESATR